MSLEKIKQAKDVADKVAKSLGKESITELNDEIRNGLNSDDPTVYDLARNQARGVVEQLSRLILRQEIFTNPDAEYVNKLVSMFNDGVVKEGNGKLYDFNNMTGVDTWDPAKFIPDSETATNVDEFKIEMYTGTGATPSLTAQAYQFKKPITFIEKDWIPYFKSGNLTKFISQLQAQIDRVYNIYMFDKLARKIKGHTPKKVVTGQAANAFEAWATEILPEIRRMTTYSSEYNAKPSATNVMVSNPEDLIVIASAKTIQTLQSGIKTQLFQAQFLNYDNLISADRIMNLGNEITIGNTSAAVSVHATTQYIDDETVIVINKNAIKHITQVNNVESQSFAHNMSTTIVMHKWGALDFLPWGQMFKYTNANLNTLP